MAGDGQVTLGQTIVKGTARKVRRLGEGRILAGFAGASADAFTLLDRFEAKLKGHRQNLARAAVELAKDWRTDRFLRELEAMLIVMDATSTLLISGTGDVVEPDQGVVAIGSGGNLRAGRGARAARSHAAVGGGGRRRGAAHRRRDLRLHQRLDHRRGADMTAPISFTPREIVERARPLHRRAEARPNARSRWRCAIAGGGRAAPAELRDEIMPKNIIMIGPTGVGKTEIARRLAKLAQGAVREGGGVEVHRGRLRRPRRGVDHPRPGRDRDRHAARGAAQARRSARRRARRRAAGPAAREAGDRARQ